jgi:diguanylate cyclase (GGDEF)-like protein
MGLLDYGRDNGRVRKPSEVVQKHRRLLDMVQPVESQPQQTASDAFGDYYAKLAQDNPKHDKNLMSQGILDLHQDGRIPNRFPTAEELEIIGRNRIARQQLPVPEAGYLDTGIKGIARGTERMAGGLNSLLQWGIESGGMIPGFSHAIRGIAGQENLDRLAQPFKEGAEYWDKAAESGWAQADPQTFAGTFFENPSLKRALGIVAEAGPSLGAAAVTGGATGIPMIGALLLGLLEGAPVYGEAREAGKGIDESSFYAGITSAGTTLLEYLPIDTILKFSGGTLKGAARGFIAEGVQESTQQLWQNLVAKYGYDNTRSLAEGIIESFIGGAGTGAIMGGTVAKLNRAREQGVSVDDFYKASADLEKQLTEFADQEQIRRDETRKTDEFLNTVRQNLVRGKDEKSRPFNIEHVEDYLQFAQSEDPFSDEADGLRQIIIDHRQSPRSDLRSGATLMESEAAPAAASEPTPESPVTAEDVPFAGRWAESFGRKPVRRDRIRSGATLFEGEETARRQPTSEEGQLLPSEDVQGPRTEDVPYTGRWTEGIEARRAQEAEAAAQEQWLQGRMSHLMQWVKEAQGPGQRVQRDDGSWWGWKTMYEPWFREIMSRHQVGRDDVFKAVEKGMVGDALGPRQSQIYDDFREAAAQHHEVLDGPDEGTLAQQREDRAKEELREMSNDKLAKVVSWLEDKPEFEDLHTWAKDERTYRDAFEGESGRDKRLDIDERQLTDEAIEKMAPEQAKQYLKAVRDRSMQQYIEARTDQLTGTRNRRAYDDFLANQEAAISEGRQEKPRTQAFIDLDDFKWVNDNLGHDRGDYLLKALANTAQEEDLPDMFRYGGDEFIALAPEGLSDKEFRGKVEALRDRLKDTIVKVQLPDGAIIGKKGLGFSIGIGATKEEADAEVYRDKETRLQSGLRAGRGGAEPPGVFRKPPQGVDNRGRGSAAEKASEAGSKPEVTPPSKAGPNPDAIRQAYLALSDGKPNVRVRLADLHKQLPEFSPEEINRVLSELAKDQAAGTVLYSLDDPQGITAADEKASIDVGGEKRHVVYMEGKGKVETEPEPGKRQVTKPRSDEGEEESAPAAERVKKAASGPSGQSLRVQPQIEDFGEVLEGAKKHYWANYVDKLREADTVDIASEPLSKSWPAPNYNKLIEEKVDPWAVAFVRAARESVPAKPRRWQLKGWVSQIQTLRDFSNKLLSGDISVQNVQEKLNTKEYARLRQEFERSIELYLAVGHEKSLKGVRLSQGSYSMFKGEKFNPPKTIWTVEKKAKNRSLGNWPTIISTGDTKEAAIADFKKKYDSLETGKATPKEVKFVIYSKPGDEKFYIGKKVGRNYIDLKPFDDIKTARAFMKENHDELVKLLDKAKYIPRERRETNAPRVGVDHRKGVDVTPEMFSESFGFRGVQFGNYVEGERRQTDLNDAYDALMDLAGVLNVPSKALSLNGELGLAFGARGTGGKQAPKAHYEPDTVVINLTKRTGPGSLAHELWHAIDNYFSRAAGKKAGFLSETAGAKTSGIRLEMVDAFTELKKAIDQTSLKARSWRLDRKRTKIYWSTGREMSARAFESYIVAKLQDQGASNDYLANIVSEDYWKAASELGLEMEGTFPYVEAAELPVIRAAFDNFFNVIETKETDKGIAFYSVRNHPSWYFSQLQQVVEKKLPARGTGQGLRKTIEAWSNKGEFKKEELESVGLLDWLEARGSAKVSKDEVVDFLKAGGIQVEERLRAPFGESDKDASAAYEAYMKAAEAQGLNSAEAQYLAVQFEADKPVPEWAKALLENYYKAVKAISTEVKETKFDQWQVPGGENYRELLITLPVPDAAEFARLRADRGYLTTAEAAKESGQAQYQSPHWEDPNVLAHVRFNDRTGTDGKKTLFIEEIQSDWHQEGRKKGYDTRLTDKERERLDQRRFELEMQGRVMPDGDEYRAVAREIEGITRRLEGNELPGVPDAPFKSSWPLLAMKRSIRWATENGYDRVAWTPGEVQADRYDLSKQISELHYSGTNLVAYDFDGNAVIERTGITKEELPDYVGKEVAERLLAQKPKGTLRSLSGLDLKVGGEGMKGFYDKILPAEVNKYIKKWGAKVGTTEIITKPTEADMGGRPMELGDWAFYRTDEGPQWLRADQAEGLERATKEDFADETQKAWSFEITPQMRESVMQGQPLFRAEKEAAGSTLTGPAIPGKAVSLDDIKEIFKGQSFGVNDDGSVWVLTGQGSGLEIRQVEQIAEDRVAFQVGYGRMKETGEALAGKYQNGVIELSRTAGDKWTLRHEQVHWLEDLGLLSSMDVSLLNSHIRDLHKQGKWTTANEKDVGGAEDRANFIADRLYGQEPAGYVQKILSKIRDFIDRLVNLFQRTAGGVVRDVESGRVYEKGTPFKSSSEPRFSTATPAYSVKANPDRLKQVMEDEVKASVRAMAGAFKGMDRHGLLGQIVATQEWDQTPIGKSLAEAATTGREERKHQIFNKVLNSDDGVVISDFLKNMKLEGANLAQRFKGYDLYNRDDAKLPKEYRQVKDAVTYMDENEVRWWDYKGKKGYRSKLEGQGVSGRVLEAVDHFRRSMDNALDLMRGQLAEIIAAYEAAGEAIPVIATRKTKKGKVENITLKDAYLEMGQMRGFYAPRVREAGDWHVLSLDGEGNAYRYGTPSRRQAHKLAIQLQREGHSDVRVERVERLPESIYQDLTIGKVSQALEQATASMKDVDPDTRTKLRMELVEAAADMMKSRAFRAHRIARSGRKGDVVKGYIEDPLTRFLLYNHRIAGGIAKGEAAMKMFESINGRVVPYERDGDLWVYRSKDGEIIDSKPMSDEEKASKDKVRMFRQGGVDPVKQPERYNQYIKYITEQLRNPDRFDRAINLGKAIVSFKYLGFNPRSALVNTTAMMTTAPSAIHQYAVDGKVALTQVGRALSKAGVDYVKVMRGKKLSNPDEQAFMDHIKESGYDSPQLTREAMSMLQSGYGRSWEKIMSGSMWLFSTTEQWNRGVTMLAAYRLAREQGQNHEKAMKLAKLASDRAHGIYGKGTLPSWAQGQNPAAKIAQMGYTYSKFGHNYLQMLHDLGFNKKNYKALAFALASPAVVGGTASSIVYSSVMALVNAIMRAVGDDRDPEKMVADVIRENLGDVAERTFRFGVMGAAGVDLSSSLAVGMEIPTTLLDLTGPFGGVYEDLTKAAHYLKTGQPGRAAERALPTALANFPRALREMEGATTSRGNRIWDEQGKPYIPSAAETASRLVGFRSSRRATVQERQWEGKKEIARFNERRNNIYERFRAYLARKGSPEDFQKILDDIAEYNESVINSGRRGLIPLITKQSLKRQSKRFARPTKRQRALMER